MATQSSSLDEMINDTSLENPAREFPKFSSLPSELQTTIWELAVPSNPRNLPGGIVVILNFDLANPKVILPNPKDLDSISIRRLEFDEFDDDQLDTEIKPVEAWASVLSLMRACRESRRVILRWYRLDMDSTAPGENVPWWGEDDVVFFPKASRERFTVDWIRIVWLAEAGERRNNGFSSIRHLALTIDSDIFRTLRTLDDEYNDLLTFNPPGDWEFNWPKSFPFLDCLSLMCDPGGVQFREEGSVKLYTSEDVTVHQLDGLRPAQIESRVAQNFKEKAELDDNSSEASQWYCPDVEFSVLCWKNPRDKRS